MPRFDVTNCDSQSAHNIYLHIINGFIIAIAISSKSDKTYIIIYRNHRLLYKASPVTDIYTPDVITTKMIIIRIRMVSTSKCTCFSGGCLAQCRIVRPISSKIARMLRQSTFQTRPRARARARCFISRRCCIISTG